MQLAPRAATFTRSIVTTTLVNGAGSHPDGNDAPAKPVLVTTIPPAFDTLASAQSLVQFVPKAPRSIRNLIGSVRPSTRPIYSFVFTFFSPLPLFTGSTSANPSSSPLSDPNTWIR